MLRLAAVRKAARRSYNIARSCPSSSFSTDIEYLARADPSVHTIEEAAKVPPRQGRLFASQTISPGALLSIELSDEHKVPVNVLVGDLYTAAVEATWSLPGSEGRHVQPPFRVAASSPSALDLAAEEGPAGILALARGAAVRAWAPERFCSIRVRSGGPVSVGSVTEGSVDVDSGGAVAVAKCRGGDLIVRSRGALTATVVAAQADVDTRGGPLTVDRLTGRDVKLRSRGGAVRIGTLYCERLDIDSGGGDVSIRNLRCEESGLVLSRGGAIRVGGIDGSGAERTELRSGGGVVEVQLMDRANAVAVSSGGGSIALHVPEAFDRTLAIAAGRYTGPPGCSRLTTAGGGAGAGGGGGGSGAGVLDFTDAASGPTPPQRIYGGGGDAAARIVAAAPVGAVSVDAGTGEVVVTRRSWMEMQMAARKVFGAFASPS